MVLGKKDIKEILLNYNLGEYKDHSYFPNGSVQINILVETSQGKYVLKYYFQRSYEEVRWEGKYLERLKDNYFPSPYPLKNKRGEYMGIHEKVPYMLLSYVEGIHIEELTPSHKKAVIREVAKLHRITEGIKAEERMNYSKELCEALATKEALKIGSENVLKKLDWIKSELDKLDIPESVSKGICHCDFHHTNFLFKGDKLEAILDFDDANYTYLIFDLINFIDYWSWKNKNELDIELARDLICEYEKVRKLSKDEKDNFFNIFKLQVLIDTIWFMDRGEYPDFYEKRKFEYLESLGMTLPIEDFYGE